MRMAEVIREGQSLRVVLIDGDTPDPTPVVSKVKQALVEEEVAEVVIELSGEGWLPSVPLSPKCFREVLQKLTSETLARGLPLRFKL